MKKAAIYARVSSKGQKEDETIDSQIEALKIFAAQKGYNISNSLLFLDNGFSGNNLQRPALDELRDIIRLEPVKIIFIYSPDRISRKYSYQLILLEEFRKQGVEVFFFKNGCLENTPEGKMLNHFQGIFAEYERELILDRSRRGKIFKAKKGDASVLPAVPFGYIKVKKDHITVIEIVEPNAKVVREIFKSFIYEKITIEKIVFNLEQNKIRSPKGLIQWDRSTIRDILKNPIYTGSAYYGKTERGEGILNKIRHHKSGKFRPCSVFRSKSLGSEIIFFV